jgi:hypothetical protein
MVDEHSGGSTLPWIDNTPGQEPDLFSLPEPPALPANGRFAGIYQHFVVVPETLCEEVVERTEAEPAAFGSYAAMGPHGSFELRRSDAPTSTALATWSTVTVFYYAHERHLRPVLEDMGIPVIALKRDFLHGYERVITELGQI